MPQTVRTTVELPKNLFARLKAHAAMRHSSVKAEVQAAVEKHLETQKASSDPPWMELFGGLHEYSDDLKEIQKMLDEERARIDPEDWK